MYQLLFIHYYVKTKESPALRNETYDGVVYSYRESITDWILVLSASKAASASNLRAGRASL